MNPLALLVIVAAALVWLGQWITVRAGGPLGDLPVPRRLRSRLAWWGSHRAVVGAGCAAVAVAGLTGGLLAS